MLGLPDGRIDLHRGRRGGAHTENMADFRVVVLPEAPSCPDFPPEEDLPMKPGRAVRRPTDQREGDDGRHEIRHPQQARRLLP